MSKGIELDPKYCESYRFSHYALNNRRKNFFSSIFRRYKIQPAKKDAETAIDDFNPFKERKNDHPTT